MNEPLLEDQPGTDYDTTQSASSWQVFLCAIMFLTRVPVPALPDSVWKDALKRSPLFFPLVGMWIGLATCCVLGVTLQIWSVPVAVMVALIFELLLTGAFHEDALADCFDAFGGGWSREQILTIMKDSRLGTYGMLALLTGFGSRMLLTWELVSRFESSPFHWIVILLTASTAARANSIWLMSELPPVQQKEGLAKDVGEQMKPGVAWMSNLLVSPLLILFFYFFPLQALVAVCLSWLLLKFAVNWLDRKIGGVTGDCLGCLCYLTQLVVLLAAAISLNIPFGSLT